MTPQDWIALAKDSGLVPAALALCAAIAAWIRADAVKRHADARTAQAVAEALSAYRADLALAQQLAADLAGRLHGAELKIAELEGALRGKESRMLELEEHLGSAERRSAALAAELAEQKRAARASEHLRLIERERP